VPEDLHGGISKLEVFRIKGRWGTYDNDHLVNGPPQEPAQVYMIHAKSLFPSQFSMFESGLSSMHQSNVVYPPKSECSTTELANVLTIILPSLKVVIITQDQLAEVHRKKPLALLDLVVLECEMAQVRLHRPLVACRTRHKHLFRDAKLEEMRIYAVNEFWNQRLEDKRGFVERVGV
jgi:hypothetical protein